jgi:predicted ABC-type transport system involved in lysophospholipase L1 biosynthesis ATPase subunit
MSAVLDIADALPHPEEATPLDGAVALRLAPGELALVRAPHAGFARALTELCAGLPRLASGSVWLFGTQVAELPRRAAEALRGRIGLAPGEGGWLPHLSVEDGMLLPPRHHGLRDDAELRREADALARHFGLDGVPDATPHELTRLDLARAGCARAFLQQPDLLLLESPLDAEAADALVAPLRAALEPRLAAGMAAVWITRSPRAWDDPGFPATQRFEIGAGGLAPADARKPGRKRRPSREDSTR